MFLLSGEINILLGDPFVGTPIFLLRKVIYLIIPPTPSGAGGAF